jgi:hypothetical protein
MHNTCNCRTTLPLSTVQRSNMYASELQDSVCVSFKDNGCMSQLPNYERLCAGANGAAQAAASLSACLVIITALCLLVVKLF